MKFLKILIIFILFLVANCGKDDIKPIDQLPPATTEGKNTFGCLINGEAWVAHIEDNPIFFGEKVVDAQYDDDTYFRIVAKRENADISQVFILHFDVYSDLSSVFDRLTKQRDYSHPCGEFEIDTLAFNELKILQFNKQIKILSGIFNFTAISNDCNDTLKITDGRFDVNYHY